MHGLVLAIKGLESLGHCRRLGVHKMRLGRAHRLDIPAEDPKVILGLLNVVRELVESLLLPLGFSGEITYRLINKRGS